MRFRPRLLFYLLLLPAMSMTAVAQDDGTLHILRPTMHAEQEKPELCLEFDHSLDSDMGRVQNALRLESDGKNTPIVAQNISIMAAKLCLSSLDSRHEYRLVVTGLRGADNEKLTEPYRLSFTIPDRHPTLAFATDQGKDGVMRWADNDPALRGINVARAKIELYRITDPARMTEAWRQRSQIMLAPTESAYFARHNGSLLWTSDIVLPDLPNKLQEQKVPLRAALHDNPSPGLYLVVASAPVPKTAADTELAPLAAMWLLRSNLNVRALRGLDHIYAIADRSDGSVPVKDVRFILQDANQQSLAEGKSDADGIGALALDSDKMSEALNLIGLTDTGEVAFADLAQKDDADLTLPALEASILTDKTFYAPGDTADLALTAHDTHNRTFLPADSHIEILRPDRSFYIGLPVPKDQSGLAHVQLPVPVGNGIWILDWKRADGGLLAESNLRITTNPDAPRLEIGADRALIANDGDIDLSLKSFTNSNQPMAYIAGHITLAWTRPDHLFPGWDDYRFGNGKEGATENPSTLASFITDDKGLAQLHVHLTPPASDSMALHAALITAVTDPAAGAADPAPLRLSLRPKDFIIGIRPAASDGKFAENSGAHFDVVALDGDGKRRAIDNLSYRIYEEGRSFEWYQTDGRWDYKPEPQERRIASGNLTIKGDEPNGIDWHGAAGSYRLDIVDAGGAVLARMEFSLGWENAIQSNTKREPLILTPSSQNLKAGDIVTVRFKLDDASIITAVIADDHIRKVIHQIKPAGAGDIGFTPAADWGNEIKISVEAETGDNPNARRIGQLILPMGAPPSKAPAAAPAAHPDLPALEISAAPVPTLKVGDQIQFIVALKNNTTTEASYHYVFGAPVDLKLAGATGGTLNLTAGQGRALTLTLNPSQSGAKELKLETTGTHNFHTSRSWTFAISPNSAAFTDMPEETLQPQQLWPTKTDKKTPKADGNFVFIALAPLHDAPQILADVFQSHAFTTHEIADEMALLHLWHDQIVAAQLMPEQNLALRQTHLAIRLLARQLPDGSFPSQPGGEGSMADTADALMALGVLNLPLGKTATDQAADWLKRRLDNNWFDEAERPERAGAYAALAAAGRLDAASLHHFSDTSAEKTLPPLAALQLSAAFARINDPDASIFWLNTAHIDKNADLDAQLLPWLAENQAFDSHALLPALEKISGGTNKKPPQGEAVSYFLRALWFVENREGSWRVALNNDDKNLKGILVAALPEKPLSPSIRNSGDRPLYLTEAHAGKAAPPKDDGMGRHVYRMNGAETTSADPLKRGETYLIVDEGSQPDDSGPLLVRDIAAPALTPISCALGGEMETNEQLKWIKELSPLAPIACEKLMSGIDAVLPAPSGDVKTWRIAYLAKAEWRGSFNLAPVQLREIDGRKTSRQGRSEQWRVE